MMTMRSLSVLAWLALFLPLPAKAQPVSVFAAASLNEALSEIAANWAQAGHAHPTLAFAASSTLARQIDQGAPANLFASADEKWMDWLDQHGRVAAGTRVNLLANQLVLIVPKDRARTIAVDDKLDLAALLGPTGRLSVGDPEHVPAGLYAKEALTRLGLWSQAEPRLARGEDVRAALRLVELGEAPAGIVYATDAAASTRVSVAGTFPPGSHEPIVYPFAVVKGADTADARDLLTFMRSPQAQAVFRSRGFSIAE